MNSVLFSSKKMDWETPQWLFDQLNKEFNFTCDVAASPENAKVHFFISKETNALRQDWPGVCWCNPPYGKEIGLWVKKAHEETFNGVKTVMLIPDRTDTKYFHDYIYGKHEVRFLKGRLKFSGSKNSAPFPSMIVIFNPNEVKE